MLLACAAEPTEPGAGGAGGGGGAAGDCFDDCTCVYALPSCEGETAGLCDPNESSLCLCDEVLTAETVRCSPDGAVCLLFRVDCPAYTCGWQECSVDDRGDLAASCPPGVTAAQLAELELASVCTSDRDCVPPETCSRRRHNRMFCGP